ncbi:hypothetical protein H2248_010629 [Termitomyces sp. 'cryptogamus']|nr:hypothetical protein H2248_010629 [Termitomyces sp. 'cryptogamus']
MANPVQSNAEPLNPDGKSLYNPPTNVKSSAYKNSPNQSIHPTMDSTFTVS